MADPYSLHNPIYSGQSAIVRQAAGQPPIDSTQPAGRTVEYGSTPFYTSTPQLNNNNPQPGPNVAAPGGAFNWGQYASDPKVGFLAALNAGQTGEGAVTAANQAYNLPYGGGFAYYANKDVYATPGGGYFAKGPDGKWGWNKGDSGGSAGGPGGGAYVPGQGVPGQGSVFGGLNPQNPGVNALEAEQMKLLAEAEKPVTPQDAVIRGQVEPYAAMQEQGVRNLLSRTAETAGPNANPEAVARSASEQAAQATGAFQGQAMQNELAARRAQIQQLLQDQSGLLTTEQQMQLQEELNQLSLAQGAYQFGQNTDLRVAGL
jgi:hypothetical protein